MSANPYQTHLNWLLAILSSITGDDDILSLVLNTLSVKSPAGLSWTAATAGRAKQSAVDITAARQSLTSKQYEYYKACVASCRQWRLKTQGGQR
jgi:hypothetical protein